jgi:hypothetical protein
VLGYFGWVPPAPVRATAHVPRMRKRRKNLSRRHNHRGSSSSSSPLGLTSLSRKPSTARLALLHGESNGREARRGQSLRAPTARGGPGVDAQGECQGLDLFTGRVHQAAVPFRGYATVDDQPRRRSGVRRPYPARPYSGRETAVRAGGERRSHLIQCENRRPHPA